MSKKNAARVSVRPSVYRDVPGFTVSGRDSLGRKVSVFARTRDGAEQIREICKRDGDQFDAVNAVLRSEVGGAKKSKAQLDAEVAALAAGDNGWGPTTKPDLPPAGGTTLTVDGSSVRVIPAALRIVRDRGERHLARATKRNQDDAWLVVSAKGNVIGCMVGGGGHWSVYRRAGGEPWLLDQEAEITYKRGVEEDWRRVVAGMVRLEF